MERTVSAGVEQGEDFPADLPFRRPPARQPEAGEEMTLTWFGSPKPSESGSVTTLAASSPAAAGEPGSAAPGGPGRVSFGFDDGPIGGTRAGRGRDTEDPDSLLQRQRTGNVPANAGEPSPRGDGPPGDLPPRGSGPAADPPLRGSGSAGDPSLGGSPGGPSRRGSGFPGDLPIVRKAGNGTDQAADSDRFATGAPNGAAPAGAAWPDLNGPPVAGTGPLPGLAVPLWPDSGEPAAPRISDVSSVSGNGVSGSEVSGNEWERLDEPVVWADTPAAPAPGGPAAPPAPPRPRQSRLVTVGMTVLGVVALAAVALTGIVYYSGDDNQISDMLSGDATNQRIVSGPVTDRTVATFELLAATDRVQLRIADLGDDLYRISTPEGAGVRPSADLRDDRLRVDVTRDNAGTGGEVEVLLAAKVRWTIRFSGYSAERIVDLSAGRVKGIELVGGTRRAEMTLAQAAGTVPMKITGGIEELTLRAPTGSPVRVRMGGGAGTVTAGSRTLRDVAPGSTLTPKDWTTGNRYDVDAVAPVTLLTVETA